VRGMLPSDRVAAILAESGWALEELMIALLPLAAVHAHVSGYAVAAVALGAPRADGPGNLYLGANFEFAHQILGFTVHAEQSAANSAWLNGEQDVVALAVNTAPCGICRQFLNELASDGSLKVIVSTTGAAVEPHAGLRLSRLLPDAFGPHDLKVRGGLMRPDHHQLTLKTADPLASAALAACNASYAPYTGTYAGIALRCAGGAIYSGRYAENAAYNPSLLAIQSAVASIRMQTAPSASLAVVEAVLVEHLVGRTSQREITRLILESVSPGATLTYCSV